MDKLPRSIVRMFVFFVFAGLVVGPDAVAQGLKKGERLADYFGFQPLEIYKLEHRIGNLMVRDLDGDKVDDIAVSNNARSRIDLFLSSKKPDDDQSNRPFRKDVNDLAYDKRMREVSLPVNKEVVSIDAGDFNGDGKPDLVFYGTPAEVEILFNEGPGRFGSLKKINTGDGVERASALTVGDIDQDGRDDIVLLGDHELVFVHQTARRGRSPNPSGSPTPPRTPGLSGRWTSTAMGSRIWRSSTRPAIIRSTSGSARPRRSWGPSSGSPLKCRGRWPSARSTITRGRRSSPSRTSRAGPGC